MTTIITALQATVGVYAGIIAIGLAACLVMFVAAAIVLIGQSIYAGIAAIWAIVRGSK